MFYFKNQPFALYYNIKVVKILDKTTFMLYILTMSKLITDFQGKVLKLLAGRIDDFYLVGGTALSLYYFHHRESQDLDFFTTDYSKKRVEEIVKFLSISLKREINLIAQQPKKDKARISVYSMPIKRGESLKIDFVEDYIGLIKPPNHINGINIASLEDIYIKKVYTIAGTSHEDDLTGRKISKGTRQTAKDFFDLYCLSHTFMRLSDFSFKFCNQTMREGIIRCFHSYSRFDMKIGFLELKLKKAVDYRGIERHFKTEINNIIEKEVDFV
jgi:predicted nucleotidyltransferase